MISIEDRKLFARAESKAREVKPRVRMLQFGEYEVESGQAGKDPYTVEFNNDNGHWSASCNCSGHTKSAAPKPCYHVPSAYQAHKIQVGIRQQLKAALVAVPAIAPAPALRFCGCGAEIAQGERCEDCQADFDRACLFG